MLGYLDLHNHNKQLLGYDFQEQLYLNEKNIETHFL